MKMSQFSSSLTVVLKGYFERSCVAVDIELASSEYLM